MIHTTAWGDEVRKRGAIRVVDRFAYCPSCGVRFSAGDDGGYGCGRCYTTPKRLYVDVHYRGKRVKIYCDKQGKALDTNQRAYDLLSYINVEIENNTFDPSLYNKAEQKQYYASVKLDEYLDYKINSLAPSYQKDFKRYVKLGKEFFGARDVRDFRKIDVIGYQRHLESSLEVCSKTIKNVMDVFKAFLNWLKNDLEIIPIVPNFPYIEVQIKPFMWLSQDDQMRLLAFVPDIHEPIIRFLMLHGCRPSEARALRCKNVDLKRRAITIIGTFSGNVYREKRKGRRSRFVVLPIHPELYDYVADRVNNNLPEAFLFVNASTGEPYSQNKLRRIWDDVREKAGIDHSLRLYDATRHSYASNLSDKGVSIYKISRLLGHSSVKMTEKYVHSEVENLRTDIERLSLKCPQTVHKAGLLSKK